MGLSITGLNIMVYLSLKIVLIGVFRTQNYVMLGLNVILDYIDMYWFGYSYYWMG